MFAASKTGAQVSAAAPTDAQFNYVTMLLHGDGTNGAQNNTFLVTPPGGVGSYAGSFNGSSQYLTVPYSSAFAFGGTTNWCVEMWVYPTNIGTSNRALFLIGDGTYNFAAGSGYQLTTYISSTGTVGLNTYAGSGTSTTQLTTSTVSNNSWYHLAFTYDGTNTRIFINGVQALNTATSIALNTGMTTVTVGTTANATGSPGEYYGGYISNLRAVKGSAVYTSAFTPPTSPLTAIANTQLLTCQSATFVDNSPNAFTITNNGTATIVNPNTFPAITRNGTATQGSFSPYGSLWSNYFNGSSYINPPAGTSFQFGTGDFTVEGWFYLTSSNSAQSLIDFRSTTGSTTGFFIGVVTSGYLQVWNQSNLIYVNASIAVNAWYHFAVVRNGTTLTAYINGVQVASVSNSTNWTDNTCYVGHSSGGTEYLTGYLSNIRVVKGTALYTSAFTPSTTPLTAVTNTSLLTCQSNRFKDNSTNNFTITVNGSPSVQRFSPFRPSQPYSYATTGGSGYFNGTSDYLTLATNAALTCSGDFTFETWMYATGNPSGSATIWTLPGGQTFQFSGGQSFLLYDGSTNRTLGTIPLNTWAHVAISRSGTTIYGFLNGVQSFSFTQSATYDFSGASICYRTLAPTGYYFQGHINDVRLIKGTALYTSAFTPPSAPLTAVTNTSLLLNMANAGVTDSAAANDLRTIGDAQINTTTKKYGTGSVYFDGTGDALSIPPTVNFGFGTGDFTAEAWIYPTAVNDRCIFDWRLDNTTNANTNGTLFIDSATSKLAYWNGTKYGSTGTALTANSWYHVAMSRQSGTTRVYLNGVLDFSTATSFDFGATRPCGVGGNYSTASSPFVGYIDDLRITKGYARYTANFTPPTAALPDN